MAPGSEHLTTFQKLPSGPPRARNSLRFQHSAAAHQTREKRAPFQSGAIYKGFLNEPPCAELEGSIGQLLGLRAASREKGHRGRRGAAPLPSQPRPGRSPSGPRAASHTARPHHREKARGRAGPSPGAQDGHVPGDSRTTLWFAHTGPSTHVTCGSQSRRGPPTIETTAARG